MSRYLRVSLLIGTGHFLSHFYVLCLPPMFLAWQHSFDVSFAQLGLVVALMSGVTALLQTPVGFLVDRHGARRFLVGGTLIMTLSMAAMGLAKSCYWQRFRVSGTPSSTRPTTPSLVRRPTRPAWVAPSPGTRSAATSALRSPRPPLPR
jgi:MFS family permease